MRRHRTISLGVPVLAAALVGAWVMAAGASPAEPASAGGATGCESSAVPGISTQTIDVEGAARQYRVAVPEDPTRKRPLILNFHGANSSDVGQAVYSQLEEKGPGRGFVVITPLASAPPIWDNRETEPERDSVEASDANRAFTRALIDAAASGLCVDPHRVYATGFSNGAGMSAYLGCELSRQLAAIAPVAGVNIAAPCPDGKPMSLIAFHGTADASVAYEGGPGDDPARPNLVLPSVETAVRAWAQRADCRTKPSRQTIGTEVERIAYRGCRGTTGVELYAVSGGGHTWPGSSIDVPSLGHVTQDINAADLILDFFSEHPPPARNAKS